MERSRSLIGQPWFGDVQIATATGIAYFLAALLGQVLRVEPGLAIFWPASGISVGVLIALGARVRLPVAAAVIVASTACGLTVGRTAWLSVAFGFLNTVHTLLEQWFGGIFKLEDVRSALGFFATTEVGSAIAAAGAVTTMSFINSTVSSLQVWGLWFAASTVGVATVAPLLIGLNDAIRERLSRHELMEGWAAIMALTVLILFLISKLEETEEPELNSGKVNCAQSLALRLCCPLACAGGY